MKKKERKYVTDTKLVGRWDFENNAKMGKYPGMVVVGSSYKAYWLCGNGHSYRREVRDEVKTPSKCRTCNTVGFKRPDLIQLWSDKNDKSPFDYTLGSPEKVFWKCIDDETHPDFEQHIRDKVKKGYGCPYCRGLKVCLTNSLGFIRPEIVELWSDKNNKTPYDYTEYSGKEVWWKCYINGEHKDYKLCIVHMTMYKIPCPECRIKSKGEGYVETILKDLGYDYDREFTYEGCVGKNKLPFDFRVTLKRGKDAVIEYDGRQHHEPVEYFGGEETFKLIKLNDSIKNKFCKENSIPLLRIKGGERFEEKDKGYIKNMVVSFLVNEELG